MKNFPEGNAIVYCEGAFNTTNGKTAHGLVRRTERYCVLSVVDSRYKGRDAGLILDQKENGIPIHHDIEEAFLASRAKGIKPTHLVMGLAPDGGRLNPGNHHDVMRAIELGLNVDSGLHDFLSRDRKISESAKRHGVKLRDVRLTPPRKNLHFFSGKIEEVRALKIAILGTDSAIGKRTTAWVLLDALRGSGLRAELIGTGQTAWMQGVRYGLILDSLINDFVSGEIEHAVWRAWEEERPEIILIEGQGSLMNPAYPGGFEILAAGRPDVVVLQHAPNRKEYDGFPGYPLHPIETQIQAIELLSGRPVVAITINHENMNREEVSEACERLNRETGLPVCDVLVQGPEKILNVLTAILKKEDYSS